MSLYNEIKPNLYYFLKCLENYNEVPFNKKIKGEEISVGFVYKELCEDFNVNIIPNIEECLSIKERVKGSKTLKGWFTLTFNKGFKARCFKEKFSDNNVFTTSTIKDELYRLMKKMEKLSDEINKADKTMIKVYKTKHSKFGHLNALEWYNLGINNLEMCKSLKIKLDKSL